MPYVLLPRATRNAILIVEHLEEYLAGYIIRIVANHAKLAGEYPAQIESQEVFREDASLQLREMPAQEIHRLPVQLDHRQVVPRLQQEAREHAHARTNLQDGQRFIILQRIRDSPRYSQIFQEMLS